MGGSKPKMPPPPPPPPAAPDEADAMPAASFLAGRAAAALRGYRAAFLSGPRGPGGPEWQAPDPTPSIPTNPAADPVVRKPRRGPRNGARGPDEKSQPPRGKPSDEELI